MYVWIVQANKGWLIKKKTSQYEVSAFSTISFSAFHSILYFPALQIQLLRGQFRALVVKISTHRCGVVGFSDFPKNNYLKQWEGRLEKFSPKKVVVQELEMPDRRRAETADLISLLLGLNWDFFELPSGKCQSAGRRLEIEAGSDCVDTIFRLKCMPDPGISEVQVECTPCALALEWLRSSAHLALALEKCRSSALLEHLLWRGAGQVRLALERCRSSGVLVHLLCM